MFCIPIIAKDTKEAIDKISKAETMADILEIRLDLMARFDLSSMITSAAKPVIITYRTIRECGKGDADYETIVKYLLNATHEGADFVDVLGTDNLDTLTIKGVLYRNVRHFKVKENQYSYYSDHYY